ncbi:M20/M25/M40 family metallo-hydrolase [Sphingomonas parva]|uniref:M20/M25/M40 family metallo-hydrolase n=1 Tax=Sphingomonas parva TaxID=2555898 RepID=A0A4Y8ZR75_9SPHN|nr:M28 family peptidase [Sphingomonas parva]TFI57782.1 M20/M25/M40 family metallo-hydrolase [Sphingomonas parva]
MKHVLLAAALLLPTAVSAAPTPPPSPRAIADNVEEARLRAIVEKLVSFGTRHTLSSQTDPARGIGAALRWTEAEFGRYAKACGGCLTVETPSQIFTGRRIPTPTKVADVLAIQRGTLDPKRVVIISGHIDSRVSDVMDVTRDAPGANDDGSGTAAVIEAARVLSRHRFPYTIVYAALSGEEQGLYGGKVLADYAKAQGWEAIAALNNDIIGNSCSSDGVCDAAHVRVFSEGPRWQGGEALRGPQRSLGGENDAPSRNISRWVDGLADDLSLGLDVRQVWRNDRFGRGGDHTEMLNLGFPAVRFSVAIENYNWQHQDLRVENGVEYGDTIDKMDFPYLRKVVQLNVAALAALASAPQPPAPVAEGAVSTDTTLTWEPVRGAAAYVVRWRPTDQANWTESLRVDAAHGAELLAPVAATANAPAQPTRLRSVLKGVRVDDFVFGVSSVSASGYESPVASAVPGGAFRPFIPPATAAQ